MIRWLAIAEWLCGEHARRAFFEPLIADWQREWQDAPQPRIVRAKILVRGVVAFLIAVATCVLSGGFDMPSRRVVLKTVMAACVSLAAVLALQTAAVAFRLGRGDARYYEYPLEVMLWMAAPAAIVIGVPLAMLPVMMLLRSARTVTTSQAVIWIGSGALVTLLSTGLSPLFNGSISDDVQERVHLRSVENDRAGKLTYPGSAIRQLRPTTPEQRAQALENLRRNPRYLAFRAEYSRPQFGPSTWWRAALAIALGSLGGYSDRLEGPLRHTPQGGGYSPSSHY